MSQVIISKTVKPQLNLAFEEYLVKKAKKDTSIFFLWQNDETVVIGRNQNPWNECDVENIKKDGINLVRRLTGGGAVFHDLGNLNFTFISENTDEKIQDNFKIVNSALAKFDIASEFTGKNDLVVGDKKISGNAFVVEGDVLCHHGTLLVDANLSRLSKYLKVSKLKLKSKGIESVRARITNIADLSEDINVTSVINKLVETFIDNSYDKTSIEVYDEKNIEEILTGFENRYENWNWNYGSTPNFEATFEDRFKWGEIQINLNITDAVITEVKTYTDANDSELSRLVESVLTNHKFDKYEILRTIYKIKNDEAKDIYNLFRRKMF